MANYVRISTICAQALRFGMGGKLHGQEAVDRMIAHWKGKFGQVLPDKPDLIVLPEACDRFPEHALAERIAYYKTRGNQVRDFFAQTAKENQCYIAYSAAREMPDGTWRNSTQIIDRAGNVAGVYNKNHVVVEETTQAGILCGKEAPIIECDFGRVACAICFDLNFAELREKYVEARPDLLVFSSMYHGGLMQAYWAYACRTHFVGAICGDQGTVISPLGEQLACTTNYFDHVTTTVNLDCKVVHLDYNWGKLTAMKKKYGPKTKMIDPGHLGCVLISSETDEFSINDMIEEFDFEILDDYMDRAMAHRHNPMNMEK